MTDYVNDLIVAPTQLDLGSDAFREALLTSEAPSVVVDCSKVGFVDSFGLRCLIEAHQAFEVDDRRLVLLWPAPHLERLLQLTGLDQVFHVER